MAGRECSLGVGQSFQMRGELRGLEFFQGANVLAKFVGVLLEFGSLRHRALRVRGRGVAHGGKGTREACRLFPGNRHWWRRERARRRRAKAGSRLLLLARRARASACSWIWAKAGAALGGVMRASDAFGGGDFRQEPGEAVPLRERLLVAGRLTRQFPTGLAQGDRLPHEPCADAAAFRIAPMFRLGERLRVQLEDHIGMPGSDEVGVDILMAGDAGIRAHVKAFQVAHAGADAGGVSPIGTRMAAEPGARGTVAAFAGN